MTDYLRIGGYASLFNIKDMSGDIVKPGAFDVSLQKRMAPMPLLLSHETRDPVGIWDSVSTDDRGLYVEGRIILNSDRSRQAARMVRESSVRGLSIGYRTADHDRRDDGRDLTTVDLWEVSVVAFPMLRDARISKIDGVED